MMLGRMRRKFTIGHPAACWNWTGARDSKGYGVIRLNHRRVLLAHRLMYSAFRQVVLPRKDFLHHICENTLCVNPFHLEVVTPKQHKAAHTKDSCRYGHPFSTNCLGQRFCRECANRRRRDRLRSDPEYAERNRAYGRAYYHEKLKSRGPNHLKQPNGLGLTDGGEWMRSRA
jgi:hypothetical protein